MVDMIIQDPEETSALKHLDHEVRIDYLFIMMYPRCASRFDLSGHFMSGQIRQFDRLTDSVLH